MDDPVIKAGRRLVVDGLKASAKELGLPVPIVNWKTHYYKEATIYTALVFVGGRETQLTFLASELRNCAVDTRQSAIGPRIHKALCR